MATLLLALVCLRGGAGSGSNFAGYQDRDDRGRTPVYGVTPYTGGETITDTDQPAHPLHQ